MKGIECRTDTYSLYEAVRSMTADIAIVQEMLVKGEIEDYHYNLSTQFKALGYMDLIT